MFQKEVMQHLVEYGMDTVSYLNNPTNSTRVVSVIEHHALFDLLKDGETLAKDTAKNHFDSYDHAALCLRVDILTGVLFPTGSQ